jgi:hypothetical protein
MLQQKIKKKNQTKSPKKLRNELIITGITILKIVFVTTMIH